MKMKCFAYFFIGFNLMASISFAQPKLMLYGAYMNISNGAFLVISNPATNAITRSAGHIISEGENNRVKWTVGTTAGTYIVPWGYSNTNYIPLTLTKTAGTGSGSFIFSTYHTATWQNSLYMPTGVLYMSDYLGAADNSPYVVDRFWQIDANGYTTKPDLTNLVFTYLDVEWSVASNTISEGRLQAQRWNPVLTKWGDWGPSGTDIPAANTVTVPQVPAANFYKWWTLTDSISPLPIELLTFDGRCEKGKIILHWSTASEINNDYFTVEKKSDGDSWVTISTLPGAGNSSEILDYNTVDESSLTAINYYRLKQTDFDGKQFFSSVIPVAGCNEQVQVSVFPNPAHDNFTIYMSQPVSGFLEIFNPIGEKVYSAGINHKQQTVNCNLAAGVYFVNISNAFGISVQKLVIQ